MYKCIDKIFIKYVPKILALGKLKNLGPWHIEIKNWSFTLLLIEQCPEFKMPAWVFRNILVFNFENKRT